MGITNIPRKPTGRVVKSKGGRIVPVRRGDEPLPAPDAQWTIALSTSNAAFAGYSSLGPWGDWQPEPEANGLVAFNASNGNDRFQAFRGDGAKWLNASAILVDITGFPGGPFQADWNDIDRYIYFDATLAAWIHTNIGGTFGVSLTAVTP